jgi:hypothetical protein
MMRLPVWYCQFFCENSLPPGPTRVFEKARVGLNPRKILVYLDSPHDAFDKIVILRTDFILRSVLL